MSEESSFGLNLAERFFGLIILVAGAVTLYYTITSADVLAAFAGFFGVLCIMLIVLGFVLMTAKTE
jgi:nicotinamide riboside transporter PnuC